MCRKILINIEFFKLGAMLGRVSPPRASLPGSKLPAISRHRTRTSAYIHMPNDCVFSGDFQIVKNSKLPFWVTHPNQAYHLEHFVFIKLPNGRGLVTSVKPLHHGININDDIPGKHRCFVSIETNTISSALLHRYNHRKPLPETTFPRIFLQFPDGNNTLYVGELHYDYGRRPSWIS